MAARKTKKTKKFSDLFGEEIEIYCDDESKNVSPYRVTPDLGLDLIKQVRDGYTILPDYS